MFDQRKKKNNKEKNTGRFILIANIKLRDILLHLELINGQNLHGQTRIINQIDKLKISIMLSVKFKFHSSSEPGRTFFKFINDELAYILSDDGSNLFDVYFFFSFDVFKSILKATAYKVSLSLLFAIFMARN